MLLIGREKDEPTRPPNVWVAENKTIKVTTYEGPLAKVCANPIRSKGPINRPPAKPTKTGLQRSLKAVHRS